MNSFTSTKSADATEVRRVYRELLDAWNNRSARDMAALFAEDGNIVGFDGSQMNGPAEITTVLGQVFAEHPTPTFVGIVREVRLLDANVVLLRAVAGMVPRGQSDINPAVNAIQSLIVAKNGDQWSIALFQNTPAAFHGRPELSEQLTEELRQALRASSTGA
jgi:uncharacterized protein (TIGR02246 family)